MRAWLDTEFTNLRRPALISLAIVTEAGDECYAELTDFPRADCSAFVVSEVLPHLGKVAGAAGSRFDTVKRLADWLAALPEPVVLMVDFYGDIELLMALFQQIWQDWPPHHALADARAMRAGWMAAGR